MNSLPVLSRPQNLKAIAQRSSRGVDFSIEVLLVALLLFLPLSLGAVQPWSESVAMGVGGLIALLLVTRICLRPSEGIPWSPALVPLVLYVLLIIVQLTSFYAGMVRLLSPATSSIKRALLSDLPSGSARLRYMTLSFYPAATKHDLRIVALAITIFVAVLVVFHSASRIRRLLGAIAVIGGLLAVLALAQDFSGATGIYWRIPLGDLPWYGTFVAHAHFGQHMNLSLGAAIGLLIALPSMPGKLRKRDWFLRASLLFIIAIGAAAIVLSRTRTGTVAMAAGGLLTFVVLVMRKGFNRKLAFGTAIVGLLIAIATIAGYDRVYSRMATLQEPNEYFLRVTTNKDLLGIWRHFPVFGTGLGTHETFYPRYDSTMMTGLSTHAEDDYAEAAEETGLFGLGCAIAFALIIWHEWKLAAFARGPEICLAAVGLGVGFLAVQIQSATDFGQHLPAIAVLTAVTSGLLVNLRRLAVPAQRTVTRTSSALLPRQLDQAEKRAVETRSRGWGSASVAGIFVLAIFMCWAVYTSTSALRAEPFVTQSRELAEVANSQTAENARTDYANMIELAKGAVAAEPDDVSHRYWLNVYRWRALQQMSGTDDIASDPAVRAAVADIVKDLDEARQLCPTYGSIYSLMGQLEYYVLHSPSSSAHLQAAALLGPHDAACGFLAGTLDADNGQWDDAARKFRLAFKFDSTKADDIVGVYVNHGRPELAADVWGDNWDWLARVSQALPDKVQATQARQRAISLLQPICATETAQGEQLAVLASLYAAAGNDTDAVDCYQMALARTGDRADWRLSRAQALHRLGRVQEARADAYLALKLQPDLPRARELEQLLARESGE